jgi:hypothetical protein
MAADGGRPLSENEYWLAKTSGGWTVENRSQVFAMHSTHDAALAHRDRLADPDDAEALDAKARALPDMPRSDAFVRRFS